MPLADSPQTAISVDDAFLSVELWAASKIVGRECSQVNLDYFKCKESKGDDPKACKHEASFVRKCPAEIIGVLKSKFAVEYTAFQKCLDYNDYRFPDCRKDERALLDCWNTHMNYVTKE